MAILEVAPFNKVLGVRVILRSPERSEAELTVREELCNRRGVLHGWGVTALGDEHSVMTAHRSLLRGAAEHEFRSHSRSLVAWNRGGILRVSCSFNPEIAPCLAPAIMIDTGWRWTPEWARQPHGDGSPALYSSLWCWP